MSLTDDQIVHELIGELLRISRVSPFKFGVEFDAKAGPCRVPIHNVEQRGTLGTVTFGFPRDAIPWLKDALMAGYTVRRAVGREWPHERSIARRRRYEEQMAKRPRIEDDDEIPF